LHTKIYSSLIHICSRPVQPKPVIFYTTHTSTYARLFLPLLLMYFGVSSLNLVREQRRNT